MHGFEVYTIRAQEGLLSACACSMNNMPAVLLQCIAEKLNLQSQTNLRATNQHIAQALQGEVQYEKEFVQPDYLMPGRDDFALKSGIALLPLLPACFDPVASQVAMSPQRWRLSLIVMELIISA